MTTTDDTPANLLLVDDDPATIQVLAKSLAGLGKLRFATSGVDALRLARASPPDLILLDMDMPGLSGFDTCRALKADPLLAEVPVIFITSHAQPSVEEAGLALGAVDFIVKPFHPAIVAARVQTQLRLKRATDQLRCLANTDGLTGVANRRVFDNALAREWPRAQRFQRSLSLLLIDIDHFKRYNDHYGHLQGDACLIRVAQTLAACARRTSDLVARYGGEEFVVLLPEIPPDGAKHQAHTLLDAVTALAIPHHDTGLGRVSISIGVTSLLGSSELPSCTATDLLASADRALYAAKNAGRARAEFATCPDLCAPASQSPPPAPL